MYGPGRGKKKKDEIVLPLKLPFYLMTCLDYSVKTKEGEYSKMYKKKEMKRELGKYLRHSFKETKYK